MLSGLLIKIIRFLFFTLPPLPAGLFNVYPHNHISRYTILIIKTGRNKNARTGFEDNALLRHHLKVQIQDAGHRSMTQKMPKKPIIISMNIYRYCDCRSRIARRGRSVTDSPRRSNDVSLPILVLTARESWQTKSKY